MRLTLPPIPTIVDVLPDDHAGHVIGYVDWMLARTQQLMARK